MADGSDNKLVEVVQPACRAVASGQISVISVVPWFPVGNDELSRLQSYAASRGAALTLDEDGAIVLRGGGRTLMRAPSLAWRERLMSRWPTPHLAWGGVVG